MATQEVALRKRQQIANANRMMFIWVAAISAVVGVAIVGSVFLFQMATFNEKVLKHKSDTASILRKNNQVISQLENKVREMNTNQALTDAMSPGQTQPIRVVLDALPSDANSSALGASLQKKFLDDPALKTESLTVDPVVGVEEQSGDGVEDASSSSDDATHEITFRFSVSADLANANALKDLLKKLERSIRAIDIVSLRIETQGSRLLLSAEGRAFYEPAKSVKLIEEELTP